MQIQVTPDEEANHLSLSGEITLLDVEQIKVELTRALESAPRVIIDTQGVSLIDVACLQLLYSAQQSALSRGKELLLDPRQPEAFSRQIDRCGLIRGHHCSGSGKKDCFWNGGDR
jgi:anti-anti-sigma factor